MNESRVLVVSHEKEIADLLCIFLELYGFEPETATDSTTGIERARELSPGILIVDPIMPVLSGVDVAARVFREQKCRAVLFLGTMATHPFYRDAMEVLRAEGCECRALGMPVDRNDLLRKLKLLGLAAYRKPPLEPSEHT